MASDLVYIVHSEPTIAKKLCNALLTADYKVVAMTSDTEAEAAINGHQFVLPDAILTPLGDLESGDSILIKLFNSNPLMEQIPVVVLASDQGDERRRALRLGLLSVILPPYDDEEVALTTQLAIEKHRSEQLLFGSLSQLSVPDLLQTAEVGRRSGIISFQHADMKGTVWLREGMVVNAVIENVCKGEEAVYAIALWDTGTFEANFCPVDVDESFAVHPSELLLEAMRRYDEGLLSPQGSTQLVVEETPRERLEAAVHLSLVVANAVAAYAANHMETTLLEERFEAIRNALVRQQPELKLFATSIGGLATVSSVPDDIYPDACVDSVARWVNEFFRLMEEALAWRFTRERLARVTEPWHREMRAIGMLDSLDLQDIAEAIPEEDASGDRAHDQKLLLGCFELGADAEILNYGELGAAPSGRDHSALVGQPFVSVLQPAIAMAAQGCLEGLAGVVVEEAEIQVKEVTLEEDFGGSMVRVAALASPMQGRMIAVLTRVRDRDPLLSPEIDRNLFKGTLTGGGAMRILAANEDFLHAFDALFAKSLSHRRHEMFHRFGKKWGLRHALRVEQLVQHEYKMTLREVESQMAIEVLSGSVGVIGLGRFDADLNFRESGIVVISHYHSPFAGRLQGRNTSSCSILAGFHAALLSYLAGRQLAARELSCSPGMGRPCTFVVATEDRLSKLFTATSGSTDHKLLARISAEAGHDLSEIGDG